MRMKVLTILAILLAGSGLKAQQPKIKCEALGAIVDSCFAASARGDDTLITYCKIADTLFTQLVNPDSSCIEVMGILLRKTAAFCSNHDMFDDGVPAATKAIELLSKTGNRRELANGYTLLGVFMTKRAFHKESLPYLEKGLEIRRQLGIEKDIANSYNNIGSVYLSYGENKTDLALKYFMQARPMAEKSEDAYLMAMTYNNIAVCYQRKQMLEPAVDYYKKTLALTRQINNRYGIANTLANLGQVYMRMRNFRASCGYSKSAGTLADSLGVAEIRKNCDYTMVVNYAGLGMADSAEFYLEHYHYIVDSLNQISHQQDLIDVEARFNLNQKKEEISLLEKQTQLSQSLVKTQRRVIWVFVIALLVIAVFGVILVRSLREIRKKNKIIEQQKALVEQKQEEIVDSIKYASRIQRALITSERNIAKTLDRLRQR